MHGPEPMLHPAEFSSSHSSLVGDTDGELVGLALVGEPVGEPLVGDVVGLSEVGVSVGFPVGLAVGMAVGPALVGVAAVKPASTTADMASHTTADGTALGRIMLQLARSADLLACFGIECRGEQRFAARETRVEVVTQVQHRPTS